MTFSANRGARIAPVLVGYVALFACSSSESNPPPRSAEAIETNAPSPGAYYVTTTGTSQAKTNAPSAANSPNRPPPTDADIRRAVEDSYVAGKAKRGGKNADYVRILADADSNLFGIAVVTLDGRVSEAGDASHKFSIQSVAKPFTLARLLEDVGPDVVEEKIGVNSTGEGFDSIGVIERTETGKAKSRLAGNPLVNAGAITTVSMISASSPEERWRKILTTMSDFAGRQLSVDGNVYKAESDANARNKSIAWLLEAHQSLGSAPLQALDIYTRQCSISVDAHDLAVMGATLANRGVNPVTRRRVVSPENVARVLAVMMTAGFYENSGHWAYRVGVPAKSGAGGGIVAVIPGRFAVATFSPPLDEAGTSVRGQETIERLVRELGGGVFGASDEAD